MILAAHAARRGLVHVIGTTGLSAEHETVIAAAGSSARIVKSGNMSLGVNLLAALVKRVARTLDADFDIEILEMHHGRKTDAPSGTALLLGRAAAAGRDIDLDKRSVRIRDGHPGARKSGDIGFASLRDTAAASTVHRAGARAHRISSQGQDRRSCPRGQGGAMGQEPQSGSLFHGRRARPVGYMRKHDGSPVGARASRQSEWNLKNLFTGWKDAAP